MRAGPSFGFPDSVDSAPLHEVEANQAGEGERLADCVLAGLRHAQQQVGDERDEDLDPDAILGSTEEVADLQVLLDPFEEQFDLPALPVESAISLAGASRSLLRMRMTLPVEMRTTISRRGSAIGFLRGRAVRSGNRPMRSDRVAALSSGSGRSAVTSIPVYLRQRPAPPRCDQAIKMLGHARTIALHGRSHWPTSLTNRDGPRAIRKW